MQTVSRDEALSHIPDHASVFIHTAAACPAYLVAGLEDLETRQLAFYHMHTEGKAPWLKGVKERGWKDYSFFVGANVRKAVQEGWADYLPIFYSEIPALFRSGRVPLDVALVQVSPPDAFGYCSLGVSVECSLAAVQSARTVIAQVNPQMPRTHGDGLIHVKEIDFAVYRDEPLPVALLSEPTQTEIHIGKYIAEEIENGSTLQMGIGNIPNAVLAQLTNHQDLGIHTELLSDGVIPLMERGVINGKMKKKHPGKVVTGFAVGSKALYDYVNDNPAFRFLDIGYVNDTAVIRQNPKVVSINSAIEIDLMGQVCADSIGLLQYSGVGGQMDFVRGSVLSPGGKSFIAIPSVTAKGISKIVPQLQPGASVVTTRSHVHTVVTEYGKADLYGKSLKERARMLIAIAHPDHREALDRAFYERFRAGMSESRI